jgi:hypothetical protein
MVMKYNQKSNHITIIENFEEAITEWDPGIQPALATG